MSVFKRGTVLEVPNENYVFNVLGEVLNSDMSKPGIIVLQQENKSSHQLSKELYVSEDFLTASGVIESVIPPKRKRSFCAYFNGIGGEYIKFIHVRGVFHQYELQIEDEFFFINCYNSDVDAVSLDIERKVWVNLRKGNASDREEAFFVLQRYFSDFAARFIVSRNWFGDPVEDSGVIG